TRDPELSALVEEPPVGVGERLAQRAERTGREVVVVVALERLKRLDRGAANRRVATGHLRQQEEASLGPYLGAHRRLAKAQDVTGVGRSLFRHRKTDTGCESIRHAGSPGVRWIRTEDGPGRCRL